MEEKKNGERKGGKYLEKENTFLQRRRSMEKVKVANIMEKENLTGGRDGTEIEGSLRGHRGPKKTKKKDTCSRVPQTYSIILNKTILCIV